MARTAQERFGGGGVLVHNAGASFSRPGGALALTDEDWLLALNTTLLPAVRLGRPLLPGMVERSSGVIRHTSPCSGPGRARPPRPTARPRPR